MQERLYSLVELGKIAIVVWRVWIELGFHCGQDGLNKGSCIRYRSVVVALSRLGPAFLDLFDDEAVGQVTWFKFHVDDDFATILVDDVMSLAVLDDLKPVPLQYLVYETACLVNIGGLIFFICTIEHGGTDVVSRVERGENDSPQCGCVIEGSKAIFRERPPRRESLTIRVVPAEPIEKRD